MGSTQIKYDSDELQRICYPTISPQEQLNSALTDLNLELFREALANGADPDRDGCPAGDGRLSAFELCCQRPGHAAFIEACLRNGCAVNKVNQSLGVTPANLAAESEDAANIAALLANARVNLGHLYNGETPLSQLCSSLTDENCVRRLPAIRLLVEHQANLNVTDERGLPPLLAVLKSRKLKNAELKRAVVDALMQQPEVIDVDTHWEGQCRELLQRNYPDIQLPEKLPDADRPWTGDRLLDALRERDEDAFVRGCEAPGMADYVRESCAAASADNRKHLMQLAIVNDLPRAVEKMLRIGAELRLAAKGFNALRSAAICGHRRLVRMLLLAADKSPELTASASAALVASVPHIGSEHPAGVDHGQCFQLLLAVPGVQLHQTDVHGNTALHLAIRYKQRDAARQLLAAGASLGARNAYGVCAIADIEASLLTAHLDECVEEPEGARRRPGEQQYEMCLRYANLVPPPPPLTTTNRIGLPDKNTNNEMTSIAHIVASRDLQHLAKHPIVASFLYLKWLRLAPMFYVNFACYAVFCVALIAQIMCRNAAVWPAANGPLILLVLLGCGYLLLREAIKVAIAPLFALRSPSTWLALLLVLLAATVTLVELPEQGRRTVGAIVILLSVSEFFVLLGSLPVMSFSTHLVMLLTVAKSFLRSLLLYSIMLIAFAMCFCTLLGKDRTEPKVVNDDLVVVTGADGAEEDDDQFNQFVSPGLAIVKTVVMLTGEFDAGSISFEQNGFSYLVFVVFVFLVSTVLFNLLNGLAVNDTAVIKADAELTNLIYRAKLLAKYEMILGGESCCNAILHKLAARRIKMFPDFLPFAAIRVRPNDGNRVRIPISPVQTTKVSPAEIEDEETGQRDVNNEFSDLQVFTGHWNSLACCFGLLRCARMEPKIVKSAQAVLDRRQQDREERTASADSDAILEKRLAQIEQSVALIAERLERLFDRAATQK